RRRPVRRLTRGRPGVPGRAAATIQGPSPARVSPRARLAIGGGSWQLPSLDKPDGDGMKIASVAEIKSQLSALLKASESGPVVVTRNGRPVAVIVGVQDEEEIERLLMAYSPRLQAILETSRKQIREGEVLSHEEFWSQIDRAPPSKGAAKPRKKRA